MDPNSGPHVFMALPLAHLSPCVTDVLEPFALSPSQPSPSTVNHYPVFYMYHPIVLHCSSDPQNTVCGPGASAPPRHLWETQILSIHSHVYLVRISGREMQ